MTSRVTLRPEEAADVLGAPDDDIEVEFADGEPTPEERARFEDEMVAIIADVIVARRSIAA